MRSSQFPSACQKSTKPSFDPRFELLLKSVQSPESLVKDSARRAFSDLRRPRFLELRKTMSVPNTVATTNFCLLKELMSFQPTTVKWSASSVPMAPLRRRSPRVDHRGTPSHPRDVVDEDVARVLQSRQLLLGTDNPRRATEHDSDTR